MWAVHMLQVAPAGCASTFVELVEQLAQPPSVSPAAACPLQDDLWQAELLLVHAVRTLEYTWDNLVPDLRRNLVSLSK